MKKVSTIWVILDKSGEYCTFGSKVAWVSSGAAKNAFYCHTGVKIDDNLDFKLVDIGT